VIAFKNLIVGRHESRVLFVWSPQEVLRYLAHSGQSKMESRPSSIETELPLRFELPSKSSAQSQARTIGTSRDSENRFCDLLATRVGRLLTLRVRGQGGG
jgi:hypothetical protein